jgi:predicted acetyltransferase
MTVEIRPAHPEEMEQFRHVISTALLMSPETFGTKEEIASSAQWTMCAFEDGKLATTYRSWPWHMRFNGKAIPVAAVNSIGTLPIYRRRGYLRKVHKAHFELLHEKGERPIAILYASMAAIYQRYGYAVTSTYNTYNVEPRYLQFSFLQAIPGTFRELGDDEFGLLVDLYRRFRADKIGYIHRSRDQWNYDILSQPPIGGILNKVVYEEDGRPLGYVIYTVDHIQEAGPRRPNHRIIIRDLVWLTISAYRAVWEYFASMDLARYISWRRVPLDDPLPHLLLEPRMLNVTSHDGLMGCIVDVERSMPERGYSEEGVLTFEIIDELCPWNQGLWKLETSVTGSSISRTKEEPQLVMPISTLAMLVFGQISASIAALMGRLEVNEDSSLSLWDNVMRTKYRPFCADYF